LRLRFGNYSQPKPRAIVAHSEREEHDPPWAHDGRYRPKRADFSRFRIADQIG
jgi:hypothetical protein